MAIGKKQGMSSIKSLYDSEGIFECGISAQNVADRISHHIENLGLPKSRHYVKKKGDGFIIYFLAHDRRHIPLSGVYLNWFLNGINAMKDLQAREKKKQKSKMEIYAPLEKTIRVMHGLCLNLHGKECGYMSIVCMQEVLEKVRESENDPEKREALDQIITSIDKKIKDTYE